jgi:phage terminase Nu1 subunit (DNA packaging protein)
VSLKTVDDWLRRGLPAIEKGKHGKTWTIDTAAAIEWIGAFRAQHAAVSPKLPGAASIESEPTRLDLNTERARESKERADKYALENAVSRRRLVAVEDVIDHWGKMISAAKRQFRGVPIRAKSAGVLPDLTHDQAGALLRLIDEALGELVGDGVPESDGSGGGSLDEGREAMGPAS